MRTKRELPPWCKSARKAMIDKDMGVKDLAEQVGITNVYASRIMTGTLIPSDYVYKRISDVLGIEYPENMMLSM